MTVLRAIDASFAGAGETVVGPFHVALRPGERIAIEEPTARAASIAARIFAAIVKPTAGAIYVGDYDTRLQPPQAKRRLGFVDCAGFGGDDHAFACEAAFRADVWGLEVPAAIGRAREVLAALAAGETPYARGIALALIPEVSFLVLDQPEPAIGEAVRAIVPALALIETRVVRAVPAAPFVIARA